MKKCEECLHGLIFLSENGYQTGCDLGEDSEVECLLKARSKYTGSVPVAVAARVYGKDPQWIRAGLISGYLPIGKATRDGKEVTDINMQGRGGRINYYISPKLLYEQTGYEWKGERK